MTAVLPATVAILGVAHIAARYTGPRWMAGLMKPLPILLLAVTVAAAAAASGEAYRWLVVAGLLCSMAGDVWLVFPEHFRRGLASFLVAHLFYIAAFSRAGMGGPAPWVLLVPLVVASGGMLGWLWPHLRGERPAVAVYVAVLAAMAGTAGMRAQVVAPPSGRLALLGALVFMVSDGTLAVDRFARPFRAADAVVMVTYYTAQTLIAASALG